MSLNWGLDCSSICSMHAPAEFWTRNRMNNEIWIKKINTGNHEFFLENLILVFGVMTSHFTSSVQLRAFVNFLTTILKMFMSSPEGGRNRQIEKKSPPYHDHHFPRFSKMISSKGILHVQSCQCVSSQTSNSWGHGPKGGYLGPPTNLVPILEQRIDERTLNFLWKREPFSQCCLRNCPFSLPC